MNKPAPGGILLATINAKWIHPSLALRLLKANLGKLEEKCSIIEFALRQPLREKLEPILAAQPRILGISVSIWNHTATLELLEHLHKAWKAEDHREEQLENRAPAQRPIVILGGPEVSYLPKDSTIFRYADYCIRGEGEDSFRELCETIFVNRDFQRVNKTVFVNREFKQVNTSEIQSAYHLYSDEDLRQKLIYVEASRGCPFGCEFCLSGATATTGGAPATIAHSPQVREFPLKPFLAEMDGLIQRGATAPPLEASSKPSTFKFLDRTFNLNIERARRIMEFFLVKIKEQQEQGLRPLVVHFEMIPSRFPPELIHTIAHFPPGTLRLEIGIQTLNPEVSARIGRPAKPDLELETIRLLREKTNAIIHADLIAGLPGEDYASFGRGFDLLWEVLSTHGTLAPVRGADSAEDSAQPQTEIQLGILKLLPGAPIARHTNAFEMRYNPAPPYEVIETAVMPEGDLNRIKNFARFWELIVNRGLADIGSSPVFERFMALSDFLLARFGQNWGIDKHELQEAVHEWIALPGKAEG